MPCHTVQHVMPVLIWSKTRWGWSQS